jgi:hypothetical protein
MCALLTEKRRLLEEKTQSIIKLESRNQFLNDLFSIIGIELINLNKSVSIILNQYNINPTGNSANMLEILTNVYKDEIKIAEESMKETMDNIGQNVKSLVDTMCKLIGDANSCRGSGDLAAENNLLREKNTELLNNMAAFTEERNKILKDAEMANANAIKLKEEIREKNIYIDGLNEKIQTLFIKVKTHPAMPYINYNEDKIAEHECICHICEKGFKREEHIVYTSIPSDNPDIEISFLNQIERETLFTKELEALKNQNTILVGYIEKLKFDLHVTEERFINSKPFQYLVSQAELMMRDIDTLKEHNLELQKQKNEIIKEKELEIRNYETRLVDVVSKLETKIIELTRLNESYKIENEVLSLKFESVQNLLKAKETVDITKLYKEFDDEKTKIIKQYEIYKDQNIKLNSIIEELRKENDLLERNELKARNEVEKYKIRLQPHEDLDLQEDGSIGMKFEKFDAREREEMKRSIASKRESLNLLDKKYTKLKLTLQTEKENSERLIKDLELNEKGLEELNKSNKSLLMQLQENTDKIARMTNEKSKDLHTIKLLNEEKDILEKRIRDQDIIIQSYLELNKKLEQDITILKDIRLKEEQEKLCKNEEIENLKKTVINYHKNNEEIRNIHETAINALNISQTNSAKHLSQYEQLKIKYENLCKIKNIYNDPNGKPQTYDDLQKEIGILSCEVDSYRVFFLI